MENVIDLMKEELQYDDMFEQFAAEAMQEQIEQTVSRLPVQCRDIFRRSRYEGKSHQEIAQEMNISVRTVETQIYRALKILKKKLKIEN